MTQRTVREGVDLGVLRRVAIDPAEARQRVLAVDVHGAGAADTLAARPAECERRVNLVLDLDERVKDLREGGGELRKASHEAGGRAD